LPHLRSRDPLHRGGQVFIPNSWPSPLAAGSRTRARERRDRPARKGPCGRRTFWVEVSSSRASERARRFDPNHITSGHGRLGRLTSTRRARAASGPAGHVWPARDPHHERPWPTRTFDQYEAGQGRVWPSARPDAWRASDSDLTSSWPNGVRPGRSGRGEARSSCWKRPGDVAAYHLGGRAGQNKERTSP